MARYRVLEDSVIGHGLVKAGEIIEYDGKSEGTPGRNLELIPEKLPRRKTPAADGPVPAVFDPDNGLGTEGSEVGGDAGEEHF